MSTTMTSDVVNPTRGEATTTEFGLLVPPSLDPATAYLLTLQSGGSRTTQRAALRAVARLFGHADETAMPWGRLRAVHTGPLPALLSARYAPNTANRCLAALRSVLAQARRQGQMTYDEFEDAVHLRAVRGERTKPGRKLAGEELRKMFTVAREDRRRRRGARDAAVLALLSGGGLRRSEVAGLQLAGFDGVAVQVLGKGNKERRVPLPEGVLRAVEDWLAVRGRHAGPLVTHLRNERRGLCAQTINQVVQDLAERAGVQKLTSHDGRRTFITDLLLAGAPVRDVQALVGHASLEQTEKYLRDTQREQAKANTVKLLAVPY